jgi:RNA polymerase sigma-70 factor (ECF subfamily)
MTAARPRTEEVFEELFEQQLTYVWNVLRRLGVREADREDLVQEVFVRVHHALATYDASRPPRPWLFAFAFRVAMDHKRLARHRTEVLGDVPDSPTSSRGPEAELDASRRRAILQDALDTLDLDKRAVIVLHEIEELPIPEVARTLGIPEGTAYTRLRAARAQLATWLRQGPGGTS